MIYWLSPGICRSEPDRSRGWKDTRIDGDTKVKIFLWPSDAGLHPRPNWMHTLMLTQSDEDNRIQTKLCELTKTSHRCGVRDIIGHGAYARRKKRWTISCLFWHPACFMVNVLFSRYVLQGSRWRVSDLTYRVTKYPTTTRLKKSEVREESNKIMEKDKLKFYR